MSFKQDIEKYLEGYCRLTKQYSYNTIRNYRNTLERMANFLDSQKIYNTNEIDMVVVNKYRTFLDEQITNRKEKMSQKAQGYQIIVLRSFLKFMIKNEGQLVLNPDSLELPKTRQRRVEFLSDKEIKKLINHIFNDDSTPPIQRARNKAIILTIFGSGLRISELTSLQKKDIMDEDGRLIIQGKGGKVRTTYLAPASLEAIEGYLAERRKDQNPYLFISHSKNVPKNPDEYKPITPRSIQMMLKNYATATGIYKKVTPHTLRHSFATKVLMDGGDLRSVQTLLGHSNISTTQIYTHVTDWKVKEVHNKVFGGVSKRKLI